MAVIASTGTNLSGALGKAAVAIWTPMATGDTGAPLTNTSFSDRSVQVTGTFNAATVSIEGSNDGTNYTVLTDTAGVALTFTATGIKQVLQVTRYIRPSVAAGTATALTVTLLTVGK